MLRSVFGVDPGPTKSALVRYDGRSVIPMLLADNGAVRAALSGRDWSPGWGPEPDRGDVLAIEAFSNYGSVLGKAVFHTIFESGRIVAAWPHGWSGVIRPAVKLHLTGTRTTGDKEVRKALIARFGPDEGKAIGSQRAPGPLYGVHTHLWAALAVAVSYWDWHGAK